MTDHKSPVMNCGHY